jgi:anti-sigma factor RsiW
MTPSALPDDWQDLIAGYASGDLSPEEAERFQHLLVMHPELATEVEDLQALVALMRYTPPEQTVPPDLRDRLLTQAQTLPQYSRSQATSPLARLNRVWVGGAIAALALVALGIDNYRLRQSLQQSQELVQLLRQPNIQLYAMRGTEEQPQAFASLVINPTQAEATIVTQNLQPLPPGEAYRLWAVVENHTDPVYCGQFSSQSDGAIAHWRLPTADCIAPNQVLITLDIADSPPVPAGPLVLQ